MTVAREVQQRSVWERFATPTVVHYATLVIAALVISYLARNQWFFFDEWTFLIPDAPGILTPHVGHLSVLPMALTWGIRAIVGLSSYWPYWLFQLAAHVALAHMLWRIMLRSRVSPWIATSLALLMLLFGTGFENIIWAFQVGFIGAMVLGLGVLLLVSRRNLGVVGSIFAGVMAMASLGTSGTSLPIFAVSIAVAWRFNGWRKTLAIFIGPVIVYAAWFLSEPRSPGAASGLGTIITFVPQYIGQMFVGGFIKAVPIPGFGTLLAVALLVWLVVRLPRLGQREFLLPAALLVAAVIFAGLSGYSRFSFGIENADSSRYVYFITAMSLPVIGAGLTSLSFHRRYLVAVACALVLLTTVYNFGQLAIVAASEGIREQGTRRQVYAALDFILKHPNQVDPAAHADSQWAPDLTVTELLRMHERGWINVGAYNGKDKLDALAQIAAIVIPVAPQGACTALSTTLGISPGDSVTLKVPSAATVGISAVGTSGEVSDPRTVDLLAGAGATIDNETGHVLSVSGLPAGVQSCQLF